MKRTLVLLPAIFTLQLAMGQCTSAVPADVVAITSENFNVLLDQNTNFWICDSAMAQLFMGNNNHFWIEADGGNNGFSSAGNTIYYKGTYPLEVTGNNNTVYTVSASVVTVQGLNSVVIECPEGVVFDYSQAPATGCFDFTGISETPFGGLSVQYDLISDRVLVNGLAGATTGELRLLDMTGRELGRLAGGATMEWSMTGYPSGYYIVQALAGNRVLAKGFVKP